MVVPRRGFSGDWVPSSGGLEGEPPPSAVGVVGCDLGSHSGGDTLPGVKNREFDSIGVGSLPSVRLSRRYLRAVGVFWPSVDCVEL